jgi:hypothetical protein
MAYTIWDVDDYCIVANFGEGLIWWFGKFVEELQI